MLPFLAIVVLGCSLFSSKSSEGEMVLAATEFGTPEGGKAAKEIGPVGGLLTSPDGRLTLTVPPDALTETIAFSIQTITNKAVNGIGLAYRLEPAGRTFTAPLEVSVRYDEGELAGTVPDALSIAYQDEQGAWHTQKVVRLDRAAKILTIEASHFSDYAFLALIQMSPGEATVYVGESQAFRLVSCRNLTFFEKIRGVNPLITCSSASLGGINKWELRGAGTMVVHESGEGVLYTAPARKPPDRIAYIDHTIEFTVREPATGRLTKVTETFRAVVTIVDYGYRATGQDGPTSYSGIVCRLDQPFNVVGTNGPVTYNLQFTPSGDGRAGSGSMVGGHSGISWTGSGAYKVEGFDSEKPRILFEVNTAARVPMAGSSGSGTAHIDLVPLNTDECRKY